MIVVDRVPRRAGHGRRGRQRPVVPGPYRIVDGVTVGFAHTEAGAEAAAAHDLLELERAMDSLSAQRTAKVAGLVATSSEARALDAHAAFGDRPGAGPWRRRCGASRSRPIRAATPRLPRRSRCLRAGSTRPRAQEALWAIERVSLIWRGGDWRVSGDRRRRAVGQRVAGRSARPARRSRESVMRRFASALAALGLAAALAVSTPAPANAGVLSTGLHIVTGAGGAILERREGRPVQGAVGGGNGGRRAPERSAAPRPAAPPPRARARPPAPPPAARWVAWSRRASASSPR